VAEKDEKAAKPIVIKKYANRRLYNTAKSSYVTLDHLSQMVREGQDFVVNDAKTGEDITRSVLAQIIFEEEAKGQTMLPANFLRQLIRLYGDTLQGFVPPYLEASMETFARNQEKMRAQIQKAFGAKPGAAELRGADAGEHGALRAGDPDVHALRRRAQRRQERGEERAQRKDVELEELKSAARRDAGQARQARRRTAERTGGRQPAGFSGAVGVRVTGDGPSILGQVRAPKR
jgi:polyhydroxyalkanoate synthesis repressor PhaR